MQPFSSNYYEKSRMAHFLFFGGMNLMLGMSPCMVRASELRPISYPS